MAITSGQISCDEYDAWLTPREALDLIGSAASLPTKQSDIAKRLSDGLVRAAAKSLAVGGQIHELYLLDKSIWKSWACNVDFPFWDLGTFTGYLSGGDTVRFNAYEVRFERDGIEKLVSGIRPQRQSLGTVSSIEDEPSQKNTGPAVSEADLKRWFTFWSGIYPIELQTEPSAIAHAQLTFPKNTVSRARIREVRGAQKSGRKSSAD